MWGTTHKDTKALKFPRASIASYLGWALDIFKANDGIIINSIIPILENWPVKEDKIARGTPEEIDRWFSEQLAEFNPIFIEYGGDGMPEVDEVTPAVIGNQFDFVREVSGSALEDNTEAIEQAAMNTGEQVSKFSYNQVRQAIGIDIKEVLPGVESLVENWVKGNVSLIKLSNLAPGDTHGNTVADIESILSESYLNGEAVDTVKAKLKGRFDFNTSRAQLIARNEIGNLNSDVTKTRLTNAGIRRAEWSTTRDEVARKSHLKADGKEFDLMVGLMVDGEEVLPGGPIQCRCTMVPIVDFTED